LTTLSSVCELIIDCEHKTAPTANSGYPLIRTPDIGVGRLHVDSAQRVDEATYQAWTKREVPRAGDLILAREAPVGNVGIVPPGVHPALGQRTVLIRTRSEVVDPHYLNYLLSGPELRGWMSGATTGATVSHLNVADIRAMPLPPLPSINTQRKSAAILSAYDDLIETNRKRIRLLEEMIQRIYREWFVDFRYPRHQSVPLVESALGPIPQGWSTVYLTDAAKFVDGRPLAKEERAGGATPVFGSNGQIGSTNRVPVNHITAVMGKIGSCGALHRVDGPGWVTNNAFEVSPASVTSPELVWQMLKSIDFAPYIGGAAIPYLPLKSFGHHLVTQPTFDLIETFQGTTGCMRECIGRLLVSATLAASARNLLLPLLMSGAIDVQDLAIELPEARP
jgi:type I restriction enzyme S subunit